MNRSFKGRSREKHNLCTQWYKFVRPEVREKRDSFVALPRVFASRARVTQFLPPQNYTHHSVMPGSRDNAQLWILSSTESCKNIPARFREWLAEMLRHRAFLGWAEEHFEGDSQSLAGMFLHNSVEANIFWSCSQIHEKYQWIVRNKAVLTDQRFQVRP